MAGGGRGLRAGSRGPRRRGRAANSFVVVDAPGVRAAGDGRIHFSNATSPVPVRVDARVGWRVDGRRSVSFVHRPGERGAFRATSVLGEDEEHIPYEDCVFSCTVVTNHVSAPKIRATVSEEKIIRLYALPETNTEVSVSSAVEVVTNGVHVIVTTWHPCPICEATHNPQVVEEYIDTYPTSYGWRAAGAGVVVPASVWAGPMAKGAGQRISFRVVGSNDCSRCVCSAATNSVVDVHELSVSRPDYLGLDRTDAGRASPVVNVAAALVDPAADGTSYSWLDCGICSFTGRTDTAEASYFAPSNDTASAAFLAEPLTVSATVSDGSGHSDSATCTTNFTVVKVDVTIDGVGEDKEESEGAFIPHVADAADGRWTEEGTNALVAVSITCEPRDLPDGETVAVTVPEKSLYVRHDGRYAAVPEHFDFSAGLLNDIKFVLHGHDESGGLRDRKIKAEHESSGAKDMAKYTDVKVDLTAMDLFGMVGENEEDQDGAYVHWNIDNDDSSDNAVGAPEHPGGDCLQTGEVQVFGEDDLKPLAMSVSPLPNVGVIALCVSNDKVKIWKSNEKGSTNLVIAGSGEKFWNLADAEQRQGFNALCSSLWVEGVTRGESKVTLSYNRNCSDTVKYTFIAANCGRQPRTHNGERDSIESSFPGLVRCEWSITGEPTDTYNCIAWSVGETNAWYVNVAGAKFHPTDIAIDEVWGNRDGTMTEDELDAFYAAKGFTPSQNSSEKAEVMYYSKFHGTRRKNCNCGASTWDVFESKCGSLFRIEHIWNQLNGSTYGEPVKFYKRK